MTLNDEPVVKLERVFLETFEKFEVMYLHYHNRMLIESGRLPLTPDQAVNLFLDLRKEHGLT